MAGLDWASMLRAGFRSSGLRPHEVWALTPAELLLLIGPNQGVLPLRRQGLKALIEAFPDMDGVRDE